MTCQISTAAALRARAEALYLAHAAAVSRGDAERGKALWTAFRDADHVAYQAEREEERERLMALYPECHD